MGDSEREEILSLARPGQLCWVVVAEFKTMDGASTAQQLKKIAKKIMKLLDLPSLN